MPLASAARESPTPPPALWGFCVVVGARGILGPMTIKTYEVVPETRPGLGNWAIRILIKGVPQEGTMGAGYETEAEARYWAEYLAAADKVPA